MARTRTRELAKLNARIRASTRVFRPVLSSVGPVLQVRRLRPVIGVRAFAVQRMGVNEVDLSIRAVQLCFSLVDRKARLELTTR